MLERKDERRAQLRVYRGGILSVRVGWRVPWCFGVFDGFEGTVQALSLLNVAKGAVQALNRDE